MNVRPPALAGTWYPANPKHLSHSIEEMIASASVTPVEGEILGVIAPHAGHMYSGLVAAHAFKALKLRDPNVVVVVSPMHQPHHGDVFSTEHNVYRTPLGDIPVTNNLVKSLRSALINHNIDLRLISNDREHSIEIELPFLQHIYPNGFELLPIMIGRSTSQLARILGETLADLLVELNVIYIGSSDLSHFYDQTTANELDKNLISAVLSFDPDKLYVTQERGEGFACGISAMGTVLWATLKRGANQIQLLNYATSGNITSDQTSVVGYASFAISKILDKG